jgi:hypothetical protein
MIVVVPIEPAKLEVRIFVAEFNKLLTDRLEIVALVIVALSEKIVSNTGSLKVANETTPFTVEVSRPDDGE